MFSQHIYMFDRLNINFSFFLFNTFWSPDSNQECTISNKIYYYIANDYCCS